MKRPDPQTVERDIAALDEMDAPALRLRWQAVYGRPAPPRIREVLLRKAIAYQLQVLAFGGLKPATVRRLAKIADALREERKRRLAGGAAGGKLDIVQPKRLAVGTQLLREWRGATEVVDVIADGFVWRGTTYRTLSAAAFAITGTKWSGPKFFGLKDNTNRVRSATDARLTESVP